MGSRGSNRERSICPNCTGLCCSNIFDTEEQKRCKTDGHQDDSSNNDTSSETHKPVIVAKLALKLKKLRDALQMQPPLRNGEVSINVYAIVDMHGRFTYVGAGKAGSCHDMAVLRDCEEYPRFPKPPPGRYYLADSGYALREGYITPFLHTRYHGPEFEGVDLRNLSREEKFNYIRAKICNVIERRFGILKRRWQIIQDGVSFMNRDKQSKIIISCFALDNYLWLLKYRVGFKYNMSKWVYMNATTSATQLREWISAAVWFNQV